LDQGNVRLADSQFLPIFIGILLFNVFVLIAGIVLSILMGHY